MPDSTGRFRGIFIRQVPWWQDDEEDEEKQEPQVERVLALRGSKTIEINTVVRETR